MEPVLNLTVQITATRDRSAGLLDMQVNVKVGGIRELDRAADAILAVVDPQAVRLGEQVGEILKAHMEMPRATTKGPAALAGAVLAATERRGEM